ncbi:RNA polymerase sigma factor [Isobaculum melis]|uniref:RNA polymerase sigma-70 factor, ECF subfamily n=1 Tax=Isobaculum melis TaxID=142588 RepID=A0A1H9SZV1_9LACT|nr:RNA polymerase sigma factor [Isobaculum melis]SER90401.1 RNA polymerase sigma-70 factor, ECF subfamily [Isobaculum melis]
MTDFEEIYTEHFATVYKFVLALCRDEALAEEVTQETFFKALRSIDSFKGNCKLSVWLCQIAKNTYYSMEKKKKRVGNEVDIQIKDPSTDLQKLLLHEEAAEKLHIILHNLKEPYKEVFTLRVFGELSHTQIAELFGKNASWARLIFYRAKKQIQEALE